MEPIKLSLIENAESFVAESLSKVLAAENDPRQWKFAILAAVQAIELILKEILRREHWTLVFQNVDKPKLTVSLEQALERLKTVSQVQFSSGDLSTLRSAISLRNQVVHADVSFEPDQVKAIVAGLIQFASHLYTRFLNAQLRDAVNRIDANIWAQAVQLDEFVHQLWILACARIQQEEVSADCILDCKACDSDEVLIASGNVATCYVCGNTEDIGWCQVCGHAVIEVDAGWLGDESDLLACNNCETTPDVVNRWWERIGDELLARRREARAASGQKPPT